MPDREQAINPMPRPKRRRLGDRAGVSIIYLFLLGATLVIAYPLVMLLLDSFKGTSEFFTSPLGWPQTWMPENYSTAWTTIPFLTLFVNSSIVTVGTLAILLVCSSTLAYALSTFRFRGRQGLGLMFVLLLIVPLPTAFIPQYIEIVKLHLDNTRTALMLIYAAGGMPLSVVLLRAFFNTIPGELLDAARIDGCAHFAAFWRIILPVAKGGLATVVIIQFINTWNDFFYPLIILHDPNLFTLALGIQNLTYEGGPNSTFSAYGVLLAALTIAIVPIVVVYTAMQRQFISGLTAGALKG